MQFPVFPLLLFSVCTAEEYWEIEVIPPMTGILQEKIGTYHQSLDTWRFDVFINLTSFKENTRFLWNCIEKTRITCENITKTSCSSLYGELLNREKMLQEKMLELYLLYHPYERIKRDLLDKVGQVGRVLFGFMDSKDSKTIYSALDKMSESEQFILEEVSHHRTTVNEIINAFNTTTKQINQNFVQIIARLNSTENSTNKLKQELVLTEIQVLLFSYLSKLERKIEELTAIAQDAHDGLISGYLFRSSKFTEAFAKLHYLKTRGVQLPFDLDNLHLQEINKIADISAYYLKDSVLISIMIPLSYSILDLYRLTSIPIRIKDSTFALVDNPYTYVGKSFGSQEIVLITTEELQRCKNVNKFDYICQHSLATHKDSSKTCLKLLLLESLTTPVCSLKAFKSQNQLWESLGSNNQWLFVLVRPTNLHIQCLQQQFITTLNGTGIFKLKFPCKAFSSEVNLLTTRTENKHASLLLSVGSMVFKDYNFSSIPDLDYYRNKQGQVKLQELGVNIPLLPKLNDTEHYKTTLDLVKNSQKRVAIYELILIIFGIILGALIVIILLIKYRKVIRRRLFAKNNNKCIQTDRIYDDVTSNFE